MFFLPVDQQWNIPRVPLTLLLFLLLLSDLACRECLYSLHGIIRIILRLLTYLIFQLTLSFPVVVLYTRHDLSSFIRVLEGVKNKQFDLGCFRCAVNTLRIQTKSNKIKTKKTSQGMLFYLYICSNYNILWSEIFYKPWSQSPCNNSFFSLPAGALIRRRER